MDLTYSFNKRTYQLICSPANEMVAVCAKKQILELVQQKYGYKNKRTQICIEPDCNNEFLYLIGYPPKAKQWEILLKIEVTDEQPEKKDFH